MEMNKKRVLLFRILAVLVLIAVAAVMMVIGRGHTVYFDSVAGEYNGTAYDTPYRIDVVVNGERVAKLYDGERGMTTWMGQNFKMSVEITEEKGGETEVYSVGVNLPYGMDGVVLNIPALMAGLPEEAYVSEFVSVATEVTGEDEEIVLDEFDNMGDI